MNKINVFSEFGKLKSVLVHRPGKELENLTPDFLEELLFDDIPFLDLAIKEHNQFTNIMEENGIKVFYIEELTAETLDQNPKLRTDFINQFIVEAGIKNNFHNLVFNFLENKNNLAMVNQMIAGIRNDEIGVAHSKDFPFIAEPLPNVLFQRDPFASIGHEVTLHHMWSKTRNRETIFPDFVFKHNSYYQNQVNYLYDRTMPDSIEGGDILVLNKKTLIIGVSQRTTMDAVKIVAKKLFAQHDGFERVVVLQLPKSRSYMHLDTVFTNIDINKFVVHPLIFDNEDEFKIFEINYNGIITIKNKLIDYLSTLTGTDVQLITCGDNEISAAREQWNDGTNVFAIAPSIVIAYDRNKATIKKLKEANVKVYTIGSSELSRGRGGPRCMSMPLVREDLIK